MMKKAIALAGLAAAFWARAESPLPPDVQERLAEAQANAVMVSEGLAEDERPWRLAAYVPDDKIAWKAGEKPVAKFRIVDADGKTVEKGALKNIYCQLGIYAGRKKTDRRIELSETGGAFEHEMTLDAPGAVTLDAAVLVEKIGENGKRVGHPKRIRAVYKDAKGGTTKKELAASVGAVFDPLKIGPGTPEPADFDAKWAAAFKADDEYAKKEPLLKRLHHTEKDGTEIWEVVLDSAGGEAHCVYAVPPLAKQGKKLPLLASFQAYGFGSVMAECWHKWATSIAVNGHSISNFQKGAYYKDWGKRLRDFGFNKKENETFENCYHVKMLLRDLRAVRWALGQKECNGEVATSGGSQGGFQAMAVAGMLPESVASAGAYCPWYVDIGGSQNHWRPKLQPGPLYADPVYWMKRAKARRVRFLAGIADTACPVDGELAMFNAIPDTCEEAQIYIYQSRGHDVGTHVKHPRVCITKRFGKAEIEYFPHGTKGVRADSTLYKPKGK